MTDFHFLDPEWLLLIIPVLMMLVVSRFRQSSASAWQNVIEPQLLQHLLQNPGATASPWLKLLSVAGTLLAIIALANPAWEKQPESVFETPRALVLVLDLSASMNAADLAPTRLVRARLKIRDILERSVEGQTGLVVFAGDAFSVAPLTRDSETITSQLRVLEPGIMPVQGSRVDLGLEQAGKLLEQAGIPAGDILVIADGLENTQTNIITRKLHQQGHRISFMGVGTLEGAPISNGRGDVIRNPNNTPVLARLAEDRFQKLAEAGGGRYTRIALNNSDIDYLLDMPALNHDKQLNETLAAQNRWKQTGPYFTLLLLPLAALAFRRGWLMLFMLVIITPLPDTAYAFSWQDLWKTPEQQASEALMQQRHEAALELSSNPDVLGSAYYRQQQFEQAFNQFKQSRGADADYNQGNALARMGKYQEAIEAYDRALQQQPDMQHAIDNKSAIEALLEQQRQQQQQSEQESDASQERQEQQPPDQNTPNDKNDQNEQRDSQSEPSASSDQAEQQPSDTAEQSEQQAGSQQADPQQAQQQNDAASLNNDFSDAAEAMEQAQQDQQENQPEVNQSEENQSEADQKKELSGKPPEEPSSQAQQARPEETQPDQSERPSPMQQQAQPLAPEEQQAAEQWLRRIPDDPGGLLKRKFLYQYQQRNRQPSSQQAW